MLQVVDNSEAERNSEENARDTGGQTPKNSRLESTPSSTPMGLVGTSFGIRRLRREIARIAPLSAPVVIYGESGSGKERVARALHEHGQNPRGPFVAVNCAAFDRNLLCSELFGHERGAFTTALATRRGLFERASGGTLFLDEVAELPLDAQAMLLRVLETGELQRLGGDETRRVRFRIVAATNRQLAKLVSSGAFRADLFWRLYVLVVFVPALSERREDIPPLCAEILDEVAPEVGERMLDDGALDLLCKHRWPGNVRQLKTVLRRASASTNLATLCRRHVVAALAAEPPELDGRQARLPPPSEATVRAALRASGGRLTPAARALGMPRSTLREHVRRLGVG